MQSGPLTESRACSAAHASGSETDLSSGAVPISWPSADRRFVTGHIRCTDVTDRSTCNAEPLHHALGCSFGRSVGLGIWETELERDEVKGALRVTYTVALRAPAVLHSAGHVRYTFPRR